MNYRLRFASLVLFVAVVLALPFVIWRAPASSAQGDETASSLSLTRDLPTDAPAIAPAVVVPEDGPGFYSQNALAFQGWPSNSTPYAFSGVKIYNPDTASHAYETFVTLPHKAVITKFTAWYYDNNSDKDMWVALARMGLNGSGISQIAHIDSTGATGSIRYGEVTTISSPVVDNQSYAYWVEIFMPPATDVGFISFRIDYRYATNLPLALK